MLAACGGGSPHAAPERGVELSFIPLDGDCGAVREVNGDPVGGRRAEVRDGQAGRKFCEFVGCHVNWVNDAGSTV